MPPATQEISQLSEQDNNKLVKDIIFHIISQEAKRPLFKKADIFRAIGLGGRDSKIKEPIFSNALKDLKDVFGYELRELETKDKRKKDCYILVNTIEESPIETQRHMKLSEKEEAQLGLLTVILSVIYMNNNLIKEDALFSFLESLDLGARDNTVHPDFGNIRQLIDKEWCQKHHYLNMEKDENSDPDQPHFIYSWGDRATVEVKKSEILKFVAEIYEKEPSEFTEQYESIRNEEGEDIFED